MTAYVEAGFLVMQGAAMFLGARVLRSAVRFVRSRNHSTADGQPLYSPRSLRGGGMPRFTAETHRRRPAPTPRGSVAATSSPSVRG